MLLNTAEIYLNPKIDSTLKRKITWWHETFHAVCDSGWIQICLTGTTMYSQAAIVQVLETSER